MSSPPRYQEPRPCKLADIRHLTGSEPLMCLFIRKDTAASKNKLFFEEEERLYFRHGCAFPMIKSIIIIFCSLLLVTVNALEMTGLPLRARSFEASQLELKASAPDVTYEPLSLP